MWATRVLLRVDAVDAARTVIANDVRPRDGHIPNNDRVYFAGVSRLGPVCRDDVDPRANELAGQGRQQVVLPLRRSISMARLWPSTYP
jgi:hypothetical protein